MNTASASETTAEQSTHNNNFFKKINTSGLSNIPFAETSLIVLINSADNFIPFPDRNTAKKQFVTLNGNSIKSAKAIPESEKSRYKIPEIKHVPKPLISIKIGKTTTPLIPNDDKPINIKKINDDKYKLKNKLVKSDVFLKFINELNQFSISLSDNSFVPLAANAPKSIPKIKKINKTKKNLYFLIFSICKPNLNVFLSAIICIAISPFI